MAYRPDAGSRRLWRLPTARPFTSAYAAEEARRNLSSNSGQRTELEELLGSVEVVLTTAPTDHPLFSTLQLADKDRPVLLAAIGVGATHLLTDDFQHFGPYYRNTIKGFSFCRRENTSLRGPNSKMPQRLHSLLVGPFGRELALPPRGCER